MRVAFIAVFLFFGVFKAEAGCSRYGCSRFDTFRDNTFIFSPVIDGGSNFAIQNFNNPFFAFNNRFANPFIFSQTGFFPQGSTFFNSNGFGTFPFSRNFNTFFPQHRFDSRFRSPFSQVGYNRGLNPFFNQGFFGGTFDPSTGFVSPTSGTPFVGTHGAGFGVGTGFDAFGRPISSFASQTVDPNSKFGQLQSEFVSGKPLTLDKLKQGQFPEQVEGVPFVRIQQQCVSQRQPNQFVNYTVLIFNKPEGATIFTSTKPNIDTKQALAQAQPLEPIRGGEFLGASWSSPDSNFPRVEVHLKQSALVEGQIALSTRLVNKRAGTQPFDTNVAGGDVPWICQNQ